MPTKTMIKSLLRRAISIIIESITRVRNIIKVNTHGVEIGAEIENTEAAGVMKIIVIEDITHPFRLQQLNLEIIAVLQDLDKLIPLGDIEIMNNLEEKIIKVVDFHHKLHLLNRKSLNSVVIHRTRTRKSVANSLTKDHLLAVVMMQQKNQVDSLNNLVSFINFKNICCRLNATACFEVQ